jgi:hypothetical protein
MVPTAKCGEGGRKQVALTSNPPSTNSPHFMESENSLQYSQQQNTCPSPKPDQSSKRPTKLYVAF